MPCNANDTASKIRLVCDLAGRPDLALEYISLKISPEQVAHELSRVCAPGWMEALRASGVISQGRYNAR
jgi:hypothetical protein